MARLPERRRYQGTIRPGGPDWVYLPVEVPDGVGELAVRYRYDRPATLPGVPGNVLDIGVLDERDAGPGLAGFRGWSGGARDQFAISRSAATAGYLPGPIGPGTWRVVLGPYTVAPQGLRWEVEVTLGEGPPGPAFVPDPAPERAAGRGRGWYRGDLHTHTVHSDGLRTPAELAAAARAAGLDFVASTEHNTSSANLGWGRHAGPDLLVLGGQEVTTRDGHWLALGQGRLDLPAHALGGDGVRAEHDLPGALADRAGQVAGGGARAAEHEVVAGSARPSPEPAPLVEQADVEDVAGGPGRGRGPVVAVADGQLAHPLRHLDRQVDPVGPAGVDGPAPAAPLRQPGHRR